MADQIITVSLPKEAWEMILRFEPTSKETYTEDGVAIFNAFQAIHQAVDQSHDKS